LYKKWAARIVHKSSDIPSIEDLISNYQVRWDCACPLHDNNDTYFVLIFIQVLIIFSNPNWVEKFRL